MKKRIKYTFGVLFFLVFLIAIWQFNALKYFASQGYGQAKISWNAQPLDDFLEKDTFADSLKEKVRLVQQIRLFTIEELGFKSSKSYTKLYDQKGEPVLWNISACEPFAFKAKIWKFPIIGSFSYKGFFDKTKALELKESLEKENWDVSMYPVSAWSTLGWLNDPILSENLNLPIGHLSALIIHELAHGTLYIKDSTTYNENLANFVGDEGAKLFLAKKYGQNSEQYQSYMNSKKDQYLFKEFVLKAAKELEELYLQSDAIPLEEKRKTKRVYIEQFIAEFKDIEFQNPRYADYFEDFEPNNAFFMGFVRYDSKRNSFEEEFENKFNSNFPAYFAYLKKKYGNLSFD